MGGGTPPTILCNFRLTFLEELLHDIAQSRHRKSLESTLIYYIHTEKYSPKSYVVNFRTQISSSQSEERTMVFTREKNDTSNQNRERCFFTCEKNDTSNQRPQRCVSFTPKFPPYIAACSAASHTFNEKSCTQRVFLAKKVKNIPEMEWNSFVCFTVDRENGREPAKQQRKGINRRRRKLLLCFLHCRSYFDFHLSLSVY